MQDLFVPIVPKQKLHPKFVDLLNSKSREGARKLLNESYQRMGDRDGNFVEQFQTHGLNSRVYELGLSEYFLSCGLKVLKGHRTPDFILESSSEKVAVEAVTTNSTLEAERTRNNLDDLKKIPFIELADKVRNEFPIKLGSSLLSKLSKKYWNLSQCKDLPFVLALQPFHEPGSLTYVAPSVAAYFYGIEANPIYEDSEKIVFNNVLLQEHQFGSKQIPSNFFAQPMTENVSAVLFSNSLTVSKFLRMAHIGGNKCPVKVMRRGFCYDPKYVSLQPLEFSYELSNSNFPQETWGQGITLFLNPNAINPLPPDFFKDLVVFRCEEDAISVDVDGFHPMLSYTVISET